MKYGLGMTRKLRVARLVAPGAELRRPVDANQEIGDAPPVAVDEHGLVDHFRAVAHRGRRTLRVTLPICVAVHRDLHDLAVFIAQMLKPGLFVFKAFGADDVGLRILFFGDAVAFDGEQVERGQVLAFDEVVQIARREDES